MIDTALNFINSFLTKEIEERSTTGPEVILSSLPKDPDENTTDKIYITLFSIEEEKVLKSLATYKADPNFPNRVQLQNPEIRLNLYVLFSAQFDKTRYKVALKFISLIITIFQGKFVFEEADFTAAERTAGLEKIIMELQSLNFDQNNQIWQTLGSKMVPSVLYKLRMVVLLDKDAPVVSSTELIQGIELNLMNK